MKDTSAARNHTARHHTTVWIIVIVSAVVIVLFAVMAGIHEWWLGQGGCESPEGLKAEQLLQLPDISAKLPKSEQQAVSRYFSMLTAKSEKRADATTKYPEAEIKVVKSAYLDQPDDRAMGVGFSSIKIVTSEHTGSTTQVTVKYDETDWICPGTTHAGCSTPPSYGADSEASDLYRRLTFQKTVASAENPSGLRLIRDSGDFDPQVDAEAGQGQCTIPWFDAWDRLGW